jgi:prevent-host-death family protein
MVAPIRTLRVSENFVPVSEFKAQAAEWLRLIAERGTPVVVTQNGRPAGVLLSPEAFDELNERAQFVTAVAAGLDDAEAGRVRADAAVTRRLANRFGGKRR